MVVFPSLRLAGEIPRASRGEHALIGVVDAQYGVVCWSYRGGLAMVGLSLRPHTRWVVRHARPERLGRFIAATFLVL